MADELRKVAADIVGHLSNIAESVREQETRDQLKYVRLNVTAQAADVFAEVAAPQGAAWIIERYSVGGAVNGVHSSYIDDRQPANLVDFLVVGGTGFAVNSAAKIFVPVGRTLKFHWNGQAAGQICTVNLQVRELVPEGSPAA